MMTSKIYICDFADVDDDADELWRSSPRISIYLSHNALSIPLSIDDTTRNVSHNVHIL